MESSKPKEWGFSERPKKCNGCKRELSEEDIITTDTAFKCKFCGYNHGIAHGRGEVRSDNEIERKMRLRINGTTKVIDYKRKKSFTKDKNGKKIQERPL